ncbi:gpaH [Symbiodinium microadriaticum]|nr:gpaH [Symbiodinium microadriaticum]
MGCMSSRAEPQQNEVDIMLKEAQEQEEMNPKILLLGAGESGKSTVVKQVKLIWKVGGGMSNREKSDYRNALRRNTIESIQVLIEASKTLKIALEDSALAKEIANLQTDADMDETLAKKISGMWGDKGIQATFERRSEFWCLDATPYYLTEVFRFASEFDVTEEDILMARIRTTGIVVTQVPDPPYVYHVVDVGGQRSERRKWIHCFDNVNAIIFLEGLSGYNQVLFEDNTVNRMQESLQLFEDIAKNPLFRDTPIFIFLNKKDLFENMIPKYPLSNCFPEYDGPPGKVRPAVEFIEKKYQDIMNRVCPGKKVFIHVIEARVRMDMKIAFGEVKETLKKITAARKGRKNR